MWQSLQIHFLLHSAITTEDLQALKNICPEAAIFTSINTAADSDTDTASESGCELPEPLTAMFDPSARDLSTADLQEKCKKIYEKMRGQCTTDRLEHLQDVTKEQAKCTIFTCCVLHLLSPHDSGYSKICGIILHDQFHYTVSWAVFAFNNSVKIAASYA